MPRGIFIFIAVFMMVMGGANAASLRGVGTASRTGTAIVKEKMDNPTSSYRYNYMYPYLNNQMRTTLKPADATDPTTNPINAVVRVEPLSAPRRVVSRPTPTTNAARSATATTSAATSQRRVVPRATTTNARVATNTNARTNETRRVVSRSGSAVPHNSNVSRNQNPAQFATENTPRATTSARCLADYTECMNRYCERADTKYNRCYCSAKLSQIDAEYQPQIESLITQIVALQSGGNAIDTNELNEYWAEMIAKYTGSNSWQNIDDALNIDWASMENRLRGQNAFITGHEYCSQHLSGCFYMASNLRDVYRSAIATDCADYESGLERLKLVAESVIQNYHE